MKLYFVGSHSSGKTTLARWAAKYYSLPLITEVARTVLAERETTLAKIRLIPEDINAFQAEILRRQLAEEAKYDAFVSDRSFDNLAYAAEYAFNLKELLKTPYSVDGTIFFVRPDKRLLVNDGVREQVEWDSVVRIDGMCKFLLESMNLDYINIATINQQERIRTIKATILPRTSNLY